MHRLLRLTLVALIGVGIGLLGYVAWLLVTNPGPRDAVGWTLLAPLPAARGETATAVANGRLYVVGGLAGLTGDASAAVSVYDPASDRWEAAAPLPAARHHAGASALDGSVLVSGGGPSAADWTPQATLWSLAPGAEAWQALAPMPEGRLGHRMLAVDGRLYVVGGIGASGRVLVYDPATDAWSPGAPMPVPRDHLAAVVVGHEIWAIGGRSAGQIQARVDIYDTEADAWRDGPALPAPTSGASEAIVDGVILVSGGEDPGALGSVIDRHWMLDTREGAAAEWRALARPPRAVHGAQGAAIDDRFLIVGGALRPGASSRFSWTDATQAYRP